MPEDSVLAEIRRILAEDLALTAPIHPATDLVADLQLDSIALITLAVGLEDRFRVRLNEEDAGGMTTVAQLTELVCRRLAEANR